MNIAEIASGLVVLLAYYQNLSLVESAVTWITDNISPLKIILILKGMSFWTMWVMSHVELCLLRAKDPNVFSCTTGDTYLRSNDEMIAAGGLVCTTRTCLSYTRLGAFQMICKCIFVQRPRVFVKTS